MCSFLDTYKHKRRRQRENYSETEKYGAGGHKFKY